MTNDSKERAHTPTPWKIGVDDGYHDGCPFVEILSNEVYGEQVIAEVQGKLNHELEIFEITPEVWGTAEHIVKCVNSHAELIDTLNYAKSTIRRLTLLRDDADKIMRASCLSQIEMVLTKAGA